VALSGERAGVAVVCHMMNFVFFEIFGKRSRGARVCFLRTKQAFDFFLKFTSSSINCFPFGVSGLSALILAAYTSLSVYSTPIQSCAFR
jgi:hypothetical protein